MIGPREQLYLGGARMVAFHGLPIVPPGCGLNVTFATINQDICLGVGAAPEAVADPYHLTRLVMEELDRLASTSAPKSARSKAKKKRSAKSGTASGGKGAKTRKTTTARRKRR